MENQEALNQKEAKLRKIEEEIEKVTDGLGLEIDPKIRDTVKFFKAHDFTTYASCEGHIDRGMPYPWVDIGDFLVDDERFQELGSKVTYDEATDTQIDNRTPEEREEHGAKVNQAKEKNNLESQRIKDLLEEFYSETGSNLRLILEQGGWNSVRLQPENMPEGNPDEIREKLTKSEIEPKLKEYQAEMNRFTEFLKAKFFSK